jgi:hypothetical protein
VTDDIVTRLRKETCHMPECCWLFTDAADQIERLRAELQHSAKAIEQLEIDGNHWIDVAQIIWLMWTKGEPPYLMFKDAVETSERLLKKGGAW